MSENVYLNITIRSKTLLFLQLHKTVKPEIIYLKYYSS